MKHQINLWFELRNFFPHCRSFTRSLVQHSKRKLRNIPSIPEKHFHCCRSSFISVLIEFTLTHPRRLAWAFQTFLKGKQHAFKQNNNNNKGREVNNGFELKYKVSAVLLFFSRPIRKTFAASNKLIKNVIKARYNSYFQAYLWQFCNPLIIFFYVFLLRCAYIMARRKAALFSTAIKWNSDELYRLTLPSQLVDTKEIQTKPIEVEERTGSSFHLAHVHNWTWKDEQLRGEKRRWKCVYKEMLSQTKLSKLIFIINLLYSIL